SRFGTVLLTQIVGIGNAFRLDQNGRNARIVGAQQRGLVDRIAREARPMAVAVIVRNGSDGGQPCRLRLVVVVGMCGPHGLDRHQYGPVPRRAGWRHAADDAVFHMRMHLARLPDTAMKWMEAVAYIARHLRADDGIAQMAEAL